ncbi:MAG: CotH kinase family protein [Patescibacteria group bacterium]|nr:CotH kinase family protein [Patescibacteria group bacterium]
MYSFRFIKRFIGERKKKVLIGLVLCLIVILPTFIYLEKNKNTLIHNKYIYNKYIWALMPVYRSLKNFVNETPNILYLHKMKSDVGIPGYQLIIERADLERLNNNLPSPFVDGAFVGFPELTDKFQKPVPAKFFAGGQEYKVKVSYRGDHSNHWTKEKKSWEINFDKDSLFNGLKAIKLIIPKSREYFAEYLDAYRAKKFGLNPAETSFISLKVNNKNYGVYYQFEDLSKEFLEKNELPVDANLYVTDDDTINLNEQNSASNDVIFWKKQTSDKIFNYDNYSEIDFLLSLQDKKEFSDILPNIINLDNFYNWQVLSILAGSSHQCDRGNWRIYFNNSRGKFEFIPWDVKIRPAIGDKIFDNILVGKILSDPKREYERNQALWNYVREEKNLADDLEVYDQIYEKLKPAFYADWTKTDNNYRFDKQVEGVRQDFINIFNDAKQLFLNDRSDLNVSYRPSKQIISIDLTVDNFSGLILESIVLPFRNLSDYAELYHDSNGDGELTAADTLVARATISKKDQRFLFNDLNQFFFSQRVYQEDTKQSSLIPKKHTLFIKLNNYSDFKSGSLDVDKVEFQFINAVTEKVVQVKR